MSFQMTDDRSNQADLFRQLVAEYHTMVYKLACYMVGSADAADLTQDIFLKVFQALGSFRGHSSMKTWVYSIALNTCRSHLRRQRRTKMVSGELIENAVYNNANSNPTEEEACAAVLKGEILKAMAALSIVDREILVLREMKGFSYQEIAEITGLGLGTVKSRLARARVSFREICVKRGLLER